MMVEQVLLSFDPGPTWTSWAAVRLDGPRVLFGSGGTIESTPAEIGQLFDLHAPHIVAIEAPAGIVFGKTIKEIQGKAKQLMATSRIAGILEGLAVARAARVEHQTAQQWRKTTCGKAAATNGNVKDLVTSTVLGMPARTNQHVRDALGLALAVAWQLSGEAA